MILVMAMTKTTVMLKLASTFNLSSISVASGTYQPTRIWLWEIYPSMYVTLSLLLLLLLWKCILKVFNGRWWCWILVKTADMSYLNVPLSLYSKFMKNQTKLLPPALIVCGVHQILICIVVQNNTLNVLCSALLSRTIFPFSLMYNIQT